MKFKNVIKNFFCNKRCRFEYLNKIGIFNHMDDRRFLELAYKNIMGENLSIDNPKTFNEKLQWLKIYDHNPLYTKMVDKCDAKEYVAKIIGNKYIIPTYGVWDNFENIDFIQLPNEFVLKCTHDSGSIVICKNKLKFDMESAKKKINNSLKRNYYFAYREWPYKNVKPRIIAEKYMQDREKTQLQDYKFMCFNGQVRCSFVCTDRYSKDGLKVTIFDKDWNVLPFERHYPKSDITIAKPKNYYKMIEFSEKLSKDIPFVRVDFYEIDGRIYFGELTFFPGAGFEEFTPEFWDKELGSWIKLPY